MPDHAAPAVPRRASPGDCYGSMMVTFDVGPPDDEEATVTAAEVAGLTAAAATSPRPLASTAELASVASTRIRTSCMLAPSGAPPRISRVITLCHVDPTTIV